MDTGALDIEVIGVLVGIVVGEAQGRAARASGARIEAHREGGAATCRHRRRRLGGHRVVRGVGAGDGHRAHSEVGGTEVIDDIGAHGHAVDDIYRAEVGMIGGRWGGIPVGNYYAIAFYLSFRG